jgi:uncharacterized delta-60 repeat protein
VDSPLTRLSLLPDGKTLAGGLVTFQNGSNQYATVRLNTDGSRDDTFSSAGFTPDVGFRNSPDDYNLWTCLEVQPNGKVLVGGFTFDYIYCDENGCATAERPFLHRVHSDGTRDAGFNPGVPIGIPTAIAIQPDGRVLAAWIGRIARFNGDGSADGTFAPVQITQTQNGGVRDFEIQPDGKILVGGGFSKIGGTNRNGIARLNANGTLDTTFDPGTGADGDVLAVALQPDGKVLVGGAFTYFNGMARNRIARLNPSGGLDSSFNPAADAVVAAILLQPDGKILIGGDFLIVNGVLRPHVARLHGDSLSPFATWAAGFGLTGASAGATADPESDGLANGVEFVLGGNPTSSDSASKHPAVAISSGYLTFTFLRDDASEAFGVTLTVESGLDLINWPDVFAIGPTTAASSPGVTVAENGTAPDLITVSIPIGSEQSRFARLKVAISP